MIKHESYFVVRTPLFPYDTADVPDLATLKVKFSDPAVQEGIYLASPGLYSRLDQLLNSSLDENELSRTSLSLKKYLLRLSRRATPFGLFAGITKGKWSDDNRTILSSKIVRHTRLDTGYVSLLVSALLRDPAILSVVKFFPNNTLYTVDNKFRYVEYQLKNNKRAYSLSSVDYQVHVQMVLNHARDGSDTVTLVRQLAEAGLDAQQAASLVGEMIESQLLISELDIRLTQLDYFSNVVSTLRRYHINLPVLNEIQNDLETLDRQGPAANLTLYPRLVDKLKSVTGDCSTDNYLQVDTCREGTVELNRGIGVAVQKAVELVSQLLPLRDNRSMSSFRKAFYERYEYRAVDLCVALDPEVGIGYPVRHTPHLNESALLKDILFPESKEPAFSEDSPFQNFLLRKYSEALATGKPIVLEEAELKPFLRSIKLPGSLYAFVSIFANASDPSKCDILLNGAYGPSAATLLARFCHLNTELTEAVRESLKKEEQRQAKAVFAEIVHANEARIGNISTRPVLRSYEIPILAHSGVDQEHTIPLSDLSLLLADGRLVLRSKRLDREVVPRLSSAHNYSNDTISAYRFLCDLQYEDVQSSIGWSWGALKQAPYLPMVKMGNIILSPAKWRLTSEETVSIKNAATLPEAVADLRRKRRIPRYVVVGESSNKIPVDLENKEHLSVFQKLIEVTEVIEESLMKDDFFFSDEKGAGYANELIIPLENTEARQEASRSEPKSGLMLRRDFTLGSEWIYFKIYCNTNVSDQILREMIKPLSSGLMRDKIVDQWFFIRYYDPDHHIRLRFRGKGNFYSEVIARFHSEAGVLLDSGLIASISTDVYRREIERYGHENIDASEALFCIDSQCIISLIGLAEDADDLPWQLALALTDQWFANFHIPLGQRKGIILDLQQKFFEELNVEHLTKKSLATKLRNNRHSIEAILGGNGLPAPIASEFRARESGMRPIVNRMLKMNAEGGLTVSLESLLKSYIHMSINRLLSANQRHHEMVLYDFLYQFYHSQSKRKESS